MDRSEKKKITRAGGQSTSTGKKVIFAATLSIVMMAMLTLAGEIYLRSRRGHVEGAIHTYAPELYSHRGQKISTVKGALKLSFAPFTIYKNLPSQQTSTFTINSRGFRAPESAEQDLRPKVIILGGSAAFGQGARSDEETISYSLEQLVTPFRVLNAGVVGFHSGQELTYLVTELIDYRPNFVIAYDGWNDLFDSMYFFERSDNELGFNNNFFAPEDQLVLDYQTKVRPYKSLVRLIDATSTRSLMLARLVRWIRTYRYRKIEIEQSSADPFTIKNKHLLDTIVGNYVRNLRNE